MTVSLVTAINRYQGVDADVRPSTDVPVGSTFYVVDTGAWEVWDGAAWQAYTFPLLDATSPNLPSTDEKAAMFASDAPDATNVFMTSSAVDGAISTALANLLSALPTVDPASVGALWNNSGVLTVSAG